MKKQIIVSALLVLFTLAINVSAQKDKLEPMPAGASLSDAQAWILKNLPKNFGYSLVDDRVKISDLKFDGCNLSYRVLQRYTDQKAAIGDRPALSRTGATEALDIPYDVHEDVWIDLKQLDPARVSLGPLPKPKGMQMIGLETIEKKDLIKFDRKGTSARYNTMGVRSLAVLPVKENAGEALGKGLQYVIRLCQAK